MNKNKRMAPQQQPHTVPCHWIISTEFVLELDRDSSFYLDIHYKSIWSNDSPKNFKLAIRILVLKTLTACFKSELTALALLLTLLIWHVTNILRTRFKKMTKRLTIVSNGQMKRFLKQTKKNIPSKSKNRPPNLNRRKEKWKSTTKEGWHPWRRNRHCLNKIWKSFTNKSSPEQVSPHKRVTHLTQQSSPRPIPKSKIWNNKCNSLIQNGKRKNKIWIRYKSNRREN